MRLSNKHDLIRILESILGIRGYKRFKDDWYLSQEDSIRVIGLGKSSYGGQFSLVLALALPELVPELLPFPPYHLCNFRGFDARFLLPDGRTLKEALDLEESVPTATRISTITTAITEYALPFLAQLDSKYSIAKQIKSNNNVGPYCDAELKLHLVSEGYLSQEDLELDL